MPSRKRTVATVALCLSIATFVTYGCGPEQPLLPGRFQDEAAVRLRRLVGQPAPQMATTDDSTEVAPETPIDVNRVLGKAITHGPRNSDMVAITLDDGPSKDSSPVLDILQREDAVVTFFYIGRRIWSNPAAAQRAVAIGCEIGDHTEDHVELVGLGSAEVRSQIERCRDAIYQITGVEPVWARPRAGRFDPDAHAVIRSESMDLVLWDTYPGDTIPSSPAAVIAQGVIARARPGSIVLLHETNPVTVHALPLVIRGLRKKGFRLVTLSTLLRGGLPVPPPVPSPRLPTWN